MWPSNYCGVCGNKAWVLSPPTQVSRLTCRRACVRLLFGTSNGVVVVVVAIVVDVVLRTLTAVLTLPKASCSRSAHGARALDKVRAFSMLVCVGPLSIASYQVLMFAVFCSILSASVCILIMLSDIPLYGRVAPLIDAVLSTAVLCCVFFSTTSAQRRAATGGSAVGGVTVAPRQGKVTISTSIWILPSRQWRNVGVVRPPSPCRRQCLVRCNPVLPTGCWRGCGSAAAACHL